MNVRATGVDASERRGGWSPTVETRLATLESPVRSVLEPHAGSLTAADRITLVPDAHYPFHPSSGMVTDPAVVGSIASHLAGWTKAEIAVAGASDDRIAFDRTAEYLGYPDLLERFDVDLVDLATDSRRETTATVDDRTVTVSVPDRLAESTVVVVPTLRPTEHGTVAGGMRTLENVVHGDGTTDPDLTAVAATRAIEPALTVLDAVTAYSGDPLAADTLLTGPTPGVDAVASSLLEYSLEEDDALRYALGDDETPVTVEGGTGAGSDVDLEALRNRLPDGELPPPDDTHPAVSVAYSVYAAVAGDAVPPQLESRR
ncbi:DUF362 domain-containing protein [Natronorubrum sp. JWXQ-INN-674]|uniref:DUF362 domain-containing protein n=1 Tax=Natronorubrum halalkaliphilum TaxID=2691917 RepID=A0A6B0VP36_9EURY|nr:DUF362 domain-containing protein [Natronorubrum halalkaliphilum]MXV62532.1 DUF362 domain-containing protein [Natronorubrum halalkaliphilum]